MRISSKYLKLIGGSLIVGGGLIFYPFFDMVVKSSLSNPDTLENISITLHVFFFTTWLIIEIPAIALIILGIFCLKKSNQR